MAKITKIVSHVLQHDLREELGYSQRFYQKRSAHLVEVQTDEGITGWGECFGPGDVALANKTIVERVIAPMILGCDPLAREFIWHHVYNLLRDHGQKGMPMQALSGVDIALWDIAAKIAGLPLYQLIGGPCREEIPVYGYGMMLRRESAKKMAARFAREAAALQAQGFAALKMKLGIGAADDVKLAAAVRRAIGDDCLLMADANHCYDIGDAMVVGRALAGLGAHWFEEPVAPEDWQGYRELRAKLAVNIAGGEAEFTRWGWRRLLESRSLDIAQPEVCAVGGVSEYLKIVAMAHAHCIPVVNHVWGSAVAIAVNLHLLAAMPPMPGGMFCREPMLEFDTTENLFIEELPQEPLDILAQVKKTGCARPPSKPGIGITPRPEMLKKYAIR
ncbi:MAG: mandelate racemase/muconate lactonizing enzyme family protein [Gammaproteobacteria bacterium]